MASRPPLLVLLIATLSVVSLTGHGQAQPSSSQPLPQPPPLASRSAGLHHRRHPPPPPPPLLSVEECWSALRGIEGCIWQVYDFVFMRSKIGEECCDAFVDVAEGCWPKMFPLQPFFGSLIRTHCYSIIGEDDP